ncbi:hypothetical protein T440DRAFT_52749 [Plenodomus tracheiphilus IPT5]|uniref:BTB domain-containing protein n=1 Tax=Plenodomus tracheiphilus IPT5 TaxID=1408161 RepID=A0A6A7AP41_9PLEO|nr:hypothetical protein T440DRAFT_52749 [Plenodomus tracheiphilus IPT5]
MSRKFLNPKTSHISRKLSLWSQLRLLRRFYENRGPLCSPYVEAPVTLHFGPEETTFYVPRHYLPSQWTESDTAARFSFPDVDSRTGHAVVHYLYKQTYEIPAFQIKQWVNRSRFNLKAAVLVFIAATDHDLAGLQLLAKCEINDSSRDLCLAEVLNVIDEDFSRLGPDSWIHEFVRHKAKTAFESDRMVFTNEAFLQDVNNTALIKFVMRCVINLYNTQNTNTLDTKESLTEVQNEPEPEDAAPSDDFSTISCPESEVPAAYEPIIESSCEIAPASPHITSSREWETSVLAPESELEIVDRVHDPLGPVFCDLMVESATIEGPAAVEGPVAAAPECQSVEAVDEEDIFGGSRCPH